MDSRSCVFLQALKRRGNNKKMKEKKKLKQKSKSSFGHFNCPGLQMQRMSNLVRSVKVVT